MLNLWENDLPLPNDDESSSEPESDVIVWEAESSFIQVTVSRTWLSEFLERMQNLKGLQYFAVEFGLAVGMLFEDLIV